MASPSLYIKLVKKARAFLRGRFMRKFPLLVKVLKPLFRREYWLPTPHRMAMGLAIGVFYAFALLVVPVQMMCSAFTCLAFRGNLPLALGACWISNPVSIIFLIKPMEWLGAYIGNFSGIHFGDKALEMFEISVNYGNFAAGCFVSGVVFGALSYPLMYVAVSRSGVYKRRREQGKI